MANLTTTDLDNGKTDLETLSTVVNSQTESTTSTRLGDTVKTVKGLTDEFEQVIADGEIAFDNAIASAGYSIVGDFSDVTKVEITADSQVYTSKSIAGFEDALWRTNQTLPYTPTGSDPTTGAELGKWVAVAQGELKGIARSLNVLDSEVVYATDTVTILDDVLYIYDASAQVTWGKPSSAGAGETIVSVVGGVLTTSAGTYALSNGVLSSGSTKHRTLEDRFSDVINVKDFGVIGDGVVDDTISAQAALTYAGVNSIGRVEAFNIELYLTGKLTVPYGVDFISSATTLVWDDSYAGNSIELLGRNTLQGFTFKNKVDLTGYHFTVDISNANDVLVNRNTFNDESDISVYIRGGSSNVEVSDNVFIEYISASTGLPSGFAVVNENASGNKIKNNKITGRNAGIVTLNPTSDITISGNTVDTVTEVGIDLLDCDYGVISSNFVKDTGLTGIRLGLESTDFPTSLVKQISVTDNQLLNCGGTGGYSISADVSGSTGDDPSDVGFHTITNNHVEYEYDVTKSYGRAMNINTSHTTIKGNRIDGGQILGSGISCGGRTKDVNISDNNIRFCVSQGILVELSNTNRQSGYRITNNVLNDVGSSSEPAIECWYVSGSIIKNNIVYGNANTTACVSLPAGCTASLVEGNQYYPLDGYPLTATQCYYATNDSTAKLIRWKDNFNDLVNTNYQSNTVFFNIGESSKVVTIDSNYTPVASVIPTLGFESIWIQSITSASVEFRRTDTSTVSYFQYTIQSNHTT